MNPDQERRSVALNAAALFVGLRTINEKGINHNASASDVISAAQSFDRFLRTGS